MNNMLSVKYFVALGVLLLLQACASAPANDRSSAVAGELSDDSLDVLFATEFPVASKQEALAKAALAYRDRELNKAQFYLVRALKFDVTDTDVLVQIGNLHIAQGNGVLAARAFNFALQQQPDNAQALEGLGLLHFRAGDNKRAQDLLDQAIATNDGLWRAHNILGVLADQRSEFHVALAHYDRALELNPKSDSVMINRGYSRYLNEEYREAALDFYDVATRSGNPKAWKNLGLVYARQGWYTSALETYLEVLNSAEAHNEIGAIAMENGDREAALQYLEEAIRQSPTYFASAEKNLSELRKSGAR